MKYSDRRRLDETRREDAPRRSTRPSSIIGARGTGRGSAYAYGSCGEVCARAEIGGGKVRKRKEPVSQSVSHPVRQSTSQSVSQAVAARSPSLVRSLTRSLLGVLIS